MYMSLAPDQGFVEEMALNLALGVLAVSSDLIRKAELGLRLAKELERGVP